NSDPLHRERDAVAASQTERRDAPREPPALQRIEQCGQHASAAGSDWMPERNRAAVHVDFLLRDPQFAKHGDHLDGKRFVDLEQVAILEFPAALLRTLATGFDRRQEDELWRQAARRLTDN